MHKVCGSKSIQTQTLLCSVGESQSYYSFFFLRVVCQRHSWELLPSYSAHYLLSRTFEDNNKARTSSLQLTSSQWGLCIPHPCSWSCEQRPCMCLAVRRTVSVMLCDSDKRGGLENRQIGLMGQQGTADDIHWLLKIYYFGLLRKIAFAISDWNFFATVHVHISL